MSSRAAKDPWVATAPAPAASLSQPQAGDTQTGVVTPRVTTQLWRVAQAEDRAARYSAYLGILGTLACLGALGALTRSSPTALVLGVLCVGLAVPTAFLWRRAVVLARRGQSLAKTAARGREGVHGWRVLEMEKRAAAKGRVSP